MGGKGNEGRGRERKGRQDKGRKGRGGKEMGEKGSDRGIEEDRRKEREGRIEVPPSPPPHHLPSIPL